ncbi:MAG: hypothetical protein IIC01_01865 [Planctomycetes bacterium]|nr:hypothetical protein [Planctomycetota bacterium]
MHTATARNRSAGWLGSVVGLGSVRRVCVALVLALATGVQAQTIEVSPAIDTVFVFSGSEGGPFAAETTTTWTVANTDLVGLELSVVSSQVWLVPVPDGGTLPGRLLRDSTLDVLATLDADEAARLAPGVYTATISFLNLDNGAGNTDRTVTLRVAAAHFVTSPSFVNAFAAQNAASPASVSVTVTSVGTSDLSYAISWIARSWFTVDKTGGTVPGGGSDSFQVSFNPFGLGPGNYTAQLTVENLTNGAGTTHLPVSLTISASAAGAVLLLPDADMQVRGVAGFLPEIREASRLVNASDRYVLWQATVSEDWLSVSPSGGELAPEDQTAGGLDEQALEVRTNLATNDLPAGPHVGMITFENLTTGVPIATRVIRVVADPVLTLPGGAVGGVINVSPAGTGIAGGSPEQSTFDHGAVLTLTAIPNEGHQFEEWVTNIELDSLTDNPIVITMDESRIVGARFAPIVRTLALSISGSGTGTVKPTPAGVSLENALVFRYTDGEVVALNVEVDAGSVFSGWAGNVPAGLENDNPLELLMDRDRTITARFEPIVTLSVQVTGDGEVIVDPDLDAYPAGSEVTLTAEAADAFEFSRWDGDASGVSAVLTVTLDASKTIEAIFVPEGTGTGTDVEEFSLFIDVTGDGVVSPGGGRFEAGTNVTLVATPGIGSAFSGWEGDASGTELATTVLMDQVRSVRAVFSAEPPAEQPGDSGNDQAGRLCGVLGWANLSLFGLSWAAFCQVSRRRGFAVDRERGNVVVNRERRPR